MNRSGGCGWDSLNFESISPSSHGRRHDRDESSEWDRIVARLRDAEAVSVRSPMTMHKAPRRSTQRLLSRTSRFSLTTLPSRKTMIVADLGRLERELEDVAVRSRECFVVAIAV